LFVWGWRTVSPKGKGGSEGRGDDNGKPVQRQNAGPSTAPFAKARTASLRMTGLVGWGKDKGDDNGKSHITA
jgi:hypothetical protein